MIDKEWSQPRFVEKFYIFWKHMKTELFSYNRSIFKIFFFKIKFFCTLVQSSLKYVFFVLFGSIIVIIIINEKRRRIWFSCPWLEFVCWFVGSSLETKTFIQKFTDTLIGTTTDQHKSRIWSYKKTGSLFFFEKK